MSDPEGNSSFCFSESPVSRDEVEGNIRTRGKTKLQQQQKNNRSEPKQSTRY